MPIRKAKTAKEPRRPIPKAANSVDATANAIRSLVGDVRTRGLDNTFTIKQFKAGPFTVGPLSFTITTKLPPKGK